MPFRPSRQTIPMDCPPLGAWSTRVQRDTQRVRPELRSTTFPGASRAPCTRGGVLDEPGRAAGAGLLLASRSWVLVTRSRRPMLLSRERRRDASTTDASRVRCARPKGTSAALAWGRCIPRVDRADDVLPHVEGGACADSLLACSVGAGRRERGTRTQGARNP